MKTRPEPKAVPERAPYFQAQVFEGKPPLVLRAPSLPTISALAKQVTPDQRNLLLGIGGRVAAGDSLLGLLLMADEVLPLLAGVVGMCWADPLLEIEAMRDPGEPLEAYGARVVEELHEEGWQMQHLVLTAVSVFDQVQKSALIDKEVAARLAFLVPKRASSRPSESASRPSGSEGSGEDPSTN